MTLLIAFLLIDMGDGNAWMKFWALVLWLLHLGYHSATGGGR